MVVGIPGDIGSAMARRTIDRLLEMEVPVVATCSSTARQVWQEEMAEPFRHVVPMLGRVLAGEREAYEYLPRSVDAFPLAGELVHLMEEAGLQNVRFRNVGMGLVAIHVGAKA